MNALLTERFRAAVERLYPGITAPEVQIEKPRIAEHGDASTNLALMLTKAVGKPPRVVAQELVDAVDLPADIV